MSDLENEYNDLLRLCKVEHLIVDVDAGSSEEVLGKILPDAAERSSMLESLGQFSFKTFTDMLQMDLKFLRSAASEFALTCPIDVFVGEFPTGSFNAQAVRVHSGALLLINDGLLTFIHQCAKIFVHSIPFIVFKDEGGEAEELKPLLSRHQAIEALADVLASYIFKGHAVFAPQLLMGDRFRNNVVGGLTAHTECFVVGHEYGHAIAGHLTEPKALHRRALKSGVSVEFIAKTWEEELEADSLGLAFLIPPSVRQAASSSGDLLDFQLRLSGPFLFFSLDELLMFTLDHIRCTEERFSMEHDHPPTIARMEGMFGALKGGSEIPPHLRIADLVIRWFRDIYRDVAEVVRAKMGDDCEQSSR